MNQQLATLNQQINDQSSQIQDQDIGKYLYNILKASPLPLNSAVNILTLPQIVYNLATDPSDAKVQIAALLKTTIDTISGTFSRLWGDKTRLQKVIDGLTSLRDQVTSLKTLFSSLKAGLVVVTTDSTSLLEVWDDVAARLEMVADVHRMATAGEVSTLVSAWNQVSNDASAYISAISAPASSASTLRAAKVLAATPKAPVTQHEIKLARILSKSDPQGQLQAR